MDEKYEFHSFDNASDFLAFIRRSNPQWLSEGEAKSHMIFRGQCNSRFHLLPSAWRENNSNFFAEVKNEIIRFSSAGTGARGEDEILLDKISEVINEDKLIHKISDYVWQVACELYLVHDFIHRANSIGLKVNKLNPFGSLANGVSISFLLEEILFNSLSSFEEKIKKQRVADYISLHSGGLYNKNLCSYFNSVTFPSFALAQHHGIPTRFLDWTKDPLKAAYFAVNSIQKNEDEGISILALDANCLSSYGLSVLDDFPHADFKFLHKQEGVFTYAEYGDGWFVKNGVWPSIEDLLNSEVRIGLLSMILPPPKVIKINLNAKHACELKRLLEAEGISAESLMPTYNHVADAICNRFL